MRVLHTMLRVGDMQRSVDFTLRFSACVYCAPVKTGI